MYQPKVVKGKLIILAITDEKLKEQLGTDDKEEIEWLRKFYNELNGVILYLALWNYDNYSSYHLSGWETKDDAKIMKATYYAEQIGGAYSNELDRFMVDWKAGDYEPDGSVVFDKDIIEEIEVYREEIKDIK